MRKNSQDNYQKRRLLSAYFSVVVSISLVLFLVGLLGLLLLNSKKVADHFKEQIAFTIYINDTAKPIEIKQLQKSLALRQETKTSRFVSKEEAAEIHAKEIGEDFMEFLGYNPLLSSIDVYFNAAFVSPAFLSQLQQDFENKAYISEVLYDQPLVEILDENIKKITEWILILSGVFILVAILLINSSIRLSIYSKRMTPSCHMSPWGHIMLSGPRWRVGLHQSRGCDERPWACWEIYVGLEHFKRRLADQPLYLLTLPPPAVF